MAPGVLEAMLPYLGEWYGNPSALHRQGRIARSAMDSAREEVASLAGCQPAQVIFCSGGTEANNLALAGTLSQLPEKRSFAVAATEHAAIMAPAKKMATLGWRLDILPVNQNGLLEREAIEALSPATRLISVMLANNETGVIQDMQPVVEAAANIGCLLHSDAVQAFGRLPFRFDASGLQLMSVSAHKMGGPKGVGALICARPDLLRPLLYGGGQENGLRSGTESVAGIVGFGKACQLAETQMNRNRQHLLALRHQLETGLTSMQGCRLFAQGVERLPNTVQCSFDGFDGSTLVMLLDRAGICISSGSSCHSAISAPSPVLTAMGIDAIQARGAIRISLGPDSSSEEIERILQTLQTTTGA